MIPVVLSGGSGTRLWPVSRASWPKPFCDLFDESLYLKTLKRLLTLGSPWTVTVEALQARTRAACGQLGLPEAQVIHEPFGRNTAPAIALLCRLFSLWGKGGEVVGVFPADHLVQDGDGLRQAVELGCRIRCQGRGAHPRHDPNAPGGDVRVHRDGERRPDTGSAPRSDRHSGSSKSRTRSRPAGCSRPATACGTPVFSCFAST